ncbi:DUF3558 domain-containing protein [Nocardia cyriacigeorgica]|uniref:DUF3558 domain-containing protein n=1 Tax=Nocardia cyriacigeorgica TaxID=135487 RepID=A0A6P1CR55_9NOCA|nr:DUF3558 domain-containing protein [Nocardia cyriacigeorgica]MBF6082032.1 DUF3558 domain-containing protein [Nocardia cyriacigeorgica]MBF6426169.1 DUF3558 domain-containing protein [Nocardia cyriacigeorgica]NEW35021.1 DUF3558 domain-containing protein [Nocardia cyriacigeorgica]BDU08645.1 hypothetical protein FMUBM48_49080 [Nocardia cyriacigeorgica]
MARRIKMMLLAGVVVPGVVACGGSTEGSPTAEGSATSTESVALFDPCTGIPDDALSVAGVIPTTEESGLGGNHQDGWEICTWAGKKYFITVFSTGKTVQEFEEKPGNVEFRDVVVAGRSGRQFKVEGASKDLGCDVLFPAEQGVVQLRVFNRYGLDDLEDPCAVLTRVGESIVPTFPN